MSTAEEKTSVKISGFEPLERKKKENPSVTFLFKGHVFPVILSCGGVDEGGASWPGQDEAELDNCLG